MEYIKQKLQQLINQGEGLITQIPKHEDYKSQERNTINRYRQEDIKNSFGREIISEGAGEFISSLLGTGKRSAKSITSNALRNQHIAQKNIEIRRLWDSYEFRAKEVESKYGSWVSEVENFVSNGMFRSYLVKFNTSKRKIKLETKINHALSVLKEILDNLDRSYSESTSVLVKAGEPLKGREKLKEFAKKSEEYLKIQDSYPTPEILQIVEAAPTNIKTVLLLGPICDKKTFEEHLALLRKSGRVIEVTILDYLSRAPFHDRFMMSKNAAVSLGTSLAGLGFRDSTIIELHQWADIEKRFDEYISIQDIYHKEGVCKKEIL